MSAQLRLPLEGWVTGISSCGWPYAHLVRSPDDPERMPRGTRPARWDWRALKQWSEDDWRRELWRVLDRPMTFNSAILAITDRCQTANIWYDTAADRALWSMCADGSIAVRERRRCLYWVRRELTEVTV